MSPHHALAIDGHNVGDGDSPAETSCVERGSSVGISSILGNVGGVVKIQNMVCYVDLQNRTRRDLRQTQLRASGSAESRSKYGSPVHRQDVPPSWQDVKSRFVFHMRSLTGISF